MISLIWCVGTNLTCLLPAIKAFKNGMDEWILYGTTGLASILYHLHREPEQALTILEYDASRYVDLVLSDMCICWITSHIMFNNLEKKFFFLFLPFEMYYVYASVKYARWIVTFFWVCLALVCIIRNFDRYDKRFLAAGLGCSALELVFYEYLSPMNYNWYHGCHHIFGFLGIYLYMHVRKDHDARAFTSLDALPIISLTKVSKVNSGSQPSDRILEESPISVSTSQGL